MYSYFHDNTYLDCPDNDELREFIKIDDKSVNIRQLPGIREKVEENYIEKVSNYNIACLKNENDHALLDKFEEFECASYLVRAFCKGNLNCEAKIFKKKWIPAKCHKEKAIRYPDFHSENVEFVNPLTGIKSIEKMFHLRLNQHARVILPYEIYVNKTMTSPYIPPFKENTPIDYIDDLLEPDDIPDINVDFGANVKSISNNS